MRISDWSSDVCSSDLCRTEPSLAHPGSLGVPPYPWAEPSSSSAWLVPPPSSHYTPAILALVAGRPTSPGLPAPFHHHCKLEVPIPAHRVVVPCNSSARPSHRRSEERRVGKECVSTCRIRCEQSNLKKKKQKKKHKNVNNN